MSATFALFILIKKITKVFKHLFYVTEARKSYL